MKDVFYWIAIIFGLWAGFFSKSLELTLFWTLILLFLVLLEVITDNANVGEAEVEDKNAT